jgi:translation initiation factor IF-3
LSPKIDPHDLGVKIGHAIDFLCEDMKVKITLKFRGREMQHTEFGFQVIEKFLNEIASYGHPDFEPKLNGRAINLMISPLPRNKRAKHPNQAEGAVAADTVPQPRPQPQPNRHAVPVPVERDSHSEESRNSGFSNNPFAQLEVKQ